MSIGYSVASPGKVDFLDGLHQKVQTSRSWMQTLLYLVCAIGLYAGSGAYVHAYDKMCGAQIKRVSFDWSRVAGSYDPYAPDDLRGRAVVTLGAKVPGTEELLEDQCEERLVVSAQVARLAGRNASLDAFVDNRVRYVRTDQLVAGQEVSVEFEVTVPSGQLVEYGDYRSEVRLVIQSEDGVNRRDRESEYFDILDYSLSIVARVPQLANVRFADTSNREQKVDFGNIGNKRIHRVSIPLLLRSTTGFTLAFSAENGGRLVNSNHPESGIPYRVSVGGSRVILSGNESLSGLSFKPNTNSIQSMDIELDGSGEYRAGRYRDRLTISVLPDLSGG